MPGFLIQNPTRIISPASVIVRYAPLATSCVWLEMKETAYRRRRPAASAPHQKDYDNDHQYRAEAAAKIMERRTHIEAAAAKNENQNNQQQD
jgi:hypothetical protein